MRKLMVVAFVLMGVSVSGCIGPNAYQSVDLGQNLDRATLDRYESEAKALKAAGHEEHMVQLERSDWWPLGLIAYHRECSVMRMETPQGPVYHLTSGHGFGPLSLLYAISTNASYTAQGERVSWMRSQAALTGCLAMGHESDAKLSDGREESSSAWHILHHVVNWHAMDGHTYVSLFALPSAPGVLVAGDH